MALLLLYAWLAGWLFMSAWIIVFVRNAPDDGDPGGVLWDLEDNLPILVAVLLVAWPVVMARLVPVCWRIISRHYLRQ